MSEERFMRMALRLAAKGWTSPNPRVGAVVVRDGEVLATGYHRAVGRPHAEVEALSQLDYQAPGATLYVNLEPCAHFGRTPPCTDTILRSGIREVVAGMVDPNPRVAGRGLERLRAGGVSVRVGLLEQACQDLNRGFVRLITSGLPYVTLKLAATADGRTATRTGASRWITSPEARRVVHRLRAQSDAILVGVGTVLEDDPSLTVRRGDRLLSRQVLRVILDSRLRAPLEARVFHDGQAPTLVMTTPACAPDKREVLEGKGVEVLTVPADEQGHVDLREALRLLAARGIVYVLAEPGAELAWALSRAGLADRFWFFYAPKLFAGANAPGMMGGEGVGEVAEAVRLRWSRVRRIGPDMLLEAFPGEGRE